MRCNDPDPLWSTLNAREFLIQLKKERNEFAKSRQEWIQAAFDLKNGDPTLFDKISSRTMRQLHTII